MTSPAKLYAKLLENPRATVSFRDFERLLIGTGFALDRTTGSHRHYVHPDVPGLLTVQPQGNDAKRYQVRQFLVMTREHRLGIES